MLLSADGNELKKIATGIGLTCLMFAATLYIPIIGFITAVLIPLPVSYYRYRLGRSAGGSIVIISCIVLAIMTEGLSFDLALFSVLLILGFVLGEMFAGGASIEKTVLYPCLAVMGTVVVLALFYGAISQTDVGSLINRYVKQNLELTLELYRQMSMPEDTLLTLSRSLETIQYVFVRIIPGMTVMSALFVTWVNLLMTRALVRLKGLKIPEVGNLNQWKSPEILVWVVIAGGVLLLIPVKFLKVVGLNVVLALIMIYFIQGISIVSFYFDKRKFPRLLRGVLYCLIGVQQLFSLLVIGLGFFDMWVDFRRINKNEKLDNAS